MPFRGRRTRKPQRPERHVVALTSVSAFEHADIPVALQPAPGVLSDAEADLLCGIGERLPGFCTRGYRSLKLSQHCGLVNLGERLLEILPKVGEADVRGQSRGVLLRLLHACSDFPLNRQPSAGQAGRSAPLLDVFIRAFFDEVTELMKGGLLRRYVEREDDCMAVRGSILLNRQLTTLANRTDFIACRYDELTADNRWNRIIKVGLRAVRPWMNGVELQRTWVELMAGFDEVTGVVDARPLLVGLRYDREGIRYRGAIDWVERILSLLSPDLRAGEKNAPGLLFDMNRLFEDAVTRRMEAWAWDRGWGVEAQNSTRYLAEIVDSPKRKAFKVRPDMLFTDHRRVVAIADAKWKHPALSKRGFILPDQSDLYQLHAYATIFGCEHLAVVYPWHEGLAGARETAFELPGRDNVKAKVTVLCVDVGEEELPVRLGGGAMVWGELK